MTSPNEALNTVATTTTAQPEALERAAAPDAGGASIDKVRDILFGNQIRDFERRFTRLDERVTKELNTLKDDMRARLEAVEAYARREVEALADRMQAEHADRMEADAGLSRDLNEATKSMERRTVALDEQLSKNQRELRQQMHDQQQRLSDEIRRRSDEVFAALSHEAQELRADKVDRGALASLLTEIALRLTNDFRLPDVEAAENG